MARNHSLKGIFGSIWDGISGIRKAIQSALDTSRQISLKVSLEAWHHWKKLDRFCLYATRRTGVLPPSAAAPGAKRKRINSFLIIDIYNFN